MKVPRSHTVEPACHGLWREPQSAAFCPSDELRHVRDALFQRLRADWWDGCPQHLRHRLHARLMEAVQGSWSKHSRVSRRLWGYARELAPGDTLLCYLVRRRWLGRDPKSGRPYLLGY